MAEEITVVSSDLERQAKQMRRHILKMIYHAGSGHPVEAIFASLDKKLMKKRWIEDNISSPKGILVESLNQARNAISDLGLTAVIKPSNSSGSRGVLIIESKDTLETVFSEAMQHFIYESSSG